MAEQGGSGDVNQLNDVLGARRAGQGLKYSVGAVVWRVCPCQHSANAHGINQDTALGVIPAGSRCLQPDCLCAEYHGKIENLGEVAEGRS